MYEFDNGALLKNAERELVYREVMHAASQLFEIGHLIPDPGTIVGRNRLLEVTQLLETLDDTLGSAVDTLKHILGDYRYVPEDPTKLPKEVK